jgi:hypothetical protein
MPDPFHFYDESALVDRLTKALRRRNQEVIFLVGAPLSAPMGPGSRGVPGVGGVIDLIKREFAEDPEQLAKLKEDVSTAGGRYYQAAFLFLQGRRGQQTANEIVRQAVCGARIRGCEHLGPAFDAVSDEACKFMDSDIAGWELNPGTEFLGRLLAAYPERFGRSILTTNFDPLIEVAIRRSGGQFFRTTLHLDGNLAQTEGTGCHVIHLHGYWHGSDTLHTARQLGQPRPRLRASLASLLRKKLVVVSAYGGWDDAFTEALMDVVRDDGAYPEVVWTFHEATPTLVESLASRLASGFNRGRVSLYSGIDCHTLFRRLFEEWSSLEPVGMPSVPGQSNPVRVSPELAHKIASRPQPKIILEGDDEDRPPLVEICVGREPEFQTLQGSDAKVVVSNWNWGPG